MNYGKITAYLIYFVDSTIFKPEFVELKSLAVLIAAF